jgi:hydroxypyruvate reductase
LVHENSIDAMNENVLIVDVLPDGLNNALEQRFVLHRLWLAPNRQAFFAQVGNLIRGVVTTWQTGFSSALLDQLPSLKIISVYGTGDQSLDLVAASNRGIIVSNTSQDGTDACVADLAIGFAITLARRIIDADRYVRSGRWREAPYAPTVHLRGKTAGIVGLGYIGQEIARRAKAFGMSVVYHDRTPIAGIPYRFIVDLRQMAAEVDFLFVANRGGPEAEGLINGRVLEALGPKGYLIHIAQAQFYDQSAVISALRQGSIAGAAIDIFDGEPQIDPAFQELDNVILSPHIGAITVEVLARRIELTVGNLTAFFDGRSISSRLA